MDIETAMRHIHRMGSEPGRSIRELIAVDTVIAEIRRLQGEAAEAEEMRYALGRED